jgi:hypothetical protein
MANNKLIHEFMGMKPEIEYCIGSKDGERIRFSPSYHFPEAYEQKKECEGWLERNKNTDYAKDDVMLKLENYPFYNNNWNELMPVISKIQDLGVGSFLELRDWAFKVCNLRICINIDSAYRTVVGFVSWYKDRCQRQG